MRCWLSGQMVFDLQTSGSTGLPKTITVNRRQLEASARMTGTAFSLGKASRALVCLNTDYVGGLMMLVRGMELDWQLTLTPASSNPLQSVPDGSIFDFAALVPLQMENILESPESRCKLDDVDTILLGGAPVSESLISSLRSLPTKVYQSYGMTETLSHIAIRRLNPVPELTYSVLPGMEVGHDQRGCLFVRGGVTDGQLVQTNDIVRFTSGDKFEWIGRADHVINSGGIKIILDLIDRQLGPILLEAGINAPFFSWYEPDDRLGQKLVLFLEHQGSEGVESTLKTRFLKAMKRYEVPKTIHFVAQFARTATEKIDKLKTADIVYKKHP